MHELSLCESILDTLNQQAISQNFQKVTAVYLEIGTLSGVEPDAIRFCFASVMQGTLADQAVLTIMIIPGQAWCPNCQAQVVIEQRYDVCPQCGNQQIQINQGEQMRIKQLEVI